MEIGVLFGITIIVYTITSLFFTSSAISNFSKKMVFQFDLTTAMAGTEVEFGDSCYVKPLVYNDAIEEMYVFIQVNLPMNEGNTIYSFDVSSE